MPVWLLALWYAVASVVAYVAYARDKAAAQAGSRRTPEATLHLVGIVGGWPGALLAQRRFRHKTRKTSFRVIFWVTVVVNVAVLAWVLSW
jgi:uncharacterized membrane protein YsdA (DUF1294 family)